MAKQEYNSSIGLNQELILLVPVHKAVFIKHCSICDTLGDEDIFTEWLKIIIAGTKVRISNDVSYLDLKHIIPALQCEMCNYFSATQVIFEWVSTNDTENKA